MRVPPPALAKQRARAPQKEHLVPFQELLPLRLRNHVSGKTGSSQDVACLQEMSVLFACLKDNEFAEKYCTKEITQFQKCFKSFQDRNFEARKMTTERVVTPGKNLHYKQLNKYLRLFPNQ